MDKKTDSVTMDGGAKIDANHPRRLKQHTPKYHALPGQSTPLKPSTFSYGMDFLQKAINSSRSLVVLNFVYGNIILTPLHVSYNRTM